jgi:hypothetical protein
MDKAQEWIDQHPEIKHANAMSKDTLSNYVVPKSKKRGCPTCDGIDPQSCLRCKGKTRLCEWAWSADGYNLFHKA